MGCWNETCGFSQQSIGSGDKVTVFPILLNKKAHRNVYACGTATPIAFPIEAAYNDYGSIENPVLGFASESTLSLFNQWYRNKKLILQEDFYRDHEEYEFDKRRGFTTIESIFNAIEREYISLKYQNHDGTVDDCTVAFMMIKQEVLDTAIDTVLKCNDYEFGPVSTYTYNTEIQYMIDTVMVAKNQQSMSENKLMEAMGQDSDNEEAEADAIAEHLQKFFNDALTRSQSVDYPWGGEDCGSPIKGRRFNACHQLRRYDSVNLHAFRTLSKITKELYTPENNDDIKQTILRFLLTLDAFTLFRKSWMPQAQASQHDNFNESIAYMESLLTKMYMERKKRNEMCEDDLYDMLV